MKIVRISVIAKLRPMQSLHAGTDEREQDTIWNQTPIVLVQYRSGIKIAGYSLQHM
jgi:hypothetical protein